MANAKGLMKNKKNNFSKKTLYTVFFNRKKINGSKGPIFFYEEL